MNHCWNVCQMWLGCNKFVTAAALRLCLKLKGIEVKSENRSR